MAATLFQSCETIYRNAADEWFRETRQAIGTQANLKELAGADSVVERVGKDSSLRCESRFSAGRIFIEKCESGRYLRRVSCYSDDGQFEWRREYCAGNFRVFEGILYRGYVYGPATWWECGTSKIAAQGVSYRGRKVGLWKELRNDRTDEVDYGNGDVLKSLPEVDGRGAVK